LYADTARPILLARKSNEVSADYTASVREGGDESDLTSARIIFVPGLKPKPPPELYEAQLSRVLLAAVERARPDAARTLAAASRWFRLVSWTYLFYGSYRDITLDLPGIERLLAGETPTDADRRAIDSWPRRIARVSHMIGDAVPLLGRWFARPSLRAQMHDATRYARNSNGIGAAIRARLRAVLEEAWTDGANVLLIGHSLGSVIAYDTLWEISHEAAPARRCVDLFMTMGSPLATHFIGRRLRGHDKSGAAKYPTNIRRWVNLSARGDTTALQPRLAPHFAEMVDLGLVESIDDYVDLDNFFQADFGINVHEAYGYLAEPKVGELVGDWLATATR
jgi:hypothetical protein